jgi:chemotaxis protein MotB
MEEHDEGGGHDSSERWLVSYADFITLLFALFVLLYALSMSSSQQVNRSWTAMATAVGARPHMGGMRPGLGDTAVSGPDLMAIGQKHQLLTIGKSIQKTLQKYPDSGITIRTDTRGMVVSLSAAKFFASGDADINPAQLPALNALIATIEHLPNNMEIDGFTDSVPIATDRFHDNWELSAARAASVLRYVVANSPIEADRLDIAGYGPYRAVGDNSTEEGRALNRRVEIIIKPMEQP